MNFKIEKALAEDIVDMVKVLTPWNLHKRIDFSHIDLSCFFVAKVDEKIVGIAGYVLLEGHSARTRTLAVYPEYQGTGIGKALQDKRLQSMYDKGVNRVETHTDRPETILWYKKHYGYIKIGQKKKSSSYSIAEHKYSTILELDLITHMKNKSYLEEKKNNYIVTNDPHPLSPYPPLIINVALTGMVPTKTLTSFVPISVDEIVEDAIRVYDAGASIVHLHARDDEGIPVSSARHYEKIISAIKKERPALICCATTSGRGGVSFEERSEVLHITGTGKPDMASLTLGSLNFLSGASINSLETIQRLAMLMKEKGIKPEMEIFDSGMVNVAKYLERHNIITGKKYFNILLGNLNTASATIDELSHIYSALPEKSTWAAAGLGNFQLPMNTAAIVAGGHVRVGMEDNIYYDSAQKRQASNKDLVERIVRISKELERPVSTALETRNLLGLDS